MQKSNKPLSKIQGKQQSVIVEIRAGAGGQEAALFVTDLFNMYSRYAAAQGWKQTMLDSHVTDIGGFKQIVFELKNGDVYSKLKYEGGVHRVQRIPKTEKSGRIHTSTASVAVLLKPEVNDLKIKPDELRIETYKASGPGGQYVNKTESAVRITHTPTGLVATSQAERSQLQNKENALAILQAKLHEMQASEQMQKLGDERKSQIGKAQRVEKKRTYNFPQDRITDHEAKKSWHDIDRIMAGKMDKIVKTLQKKLG
jgi:peptide chain release factor 1